MKNISIAIDGFSACGKSTVAKQLAKELGYSYIDTGAMYRSVTLFALNNQLFKNDELIEKALIDQLNQVNIHFEVLDGKNTTFLNGENVEEEIRSMRVSEKVSQVSTVKEVREEMVRLQQKMGEKGGVVMDGRDIGTVVMPYAELKIFMTASTEVRAQRRLKELKEKGQSVTVNEVVENLKHRDHLDSTRKESPLKQAPDAKVLDNSHLDRIQQLEIVKDWVKTIAV